MQEYGTGRYAKKHSTFFAKMMEELGLSTTPEGYLDLVPWQVLLSPLLLCACHITHMGNQATLCALV